MGGKEGLLQILNMMIFLGRGGTPYSGFLDLQTKKCCLVYIQRKKYRHTGIILARKVIPAK
jgi:hypothetical protein